MSTQNKLLFVGMFCEDIDFGAVAMIEMAVNASERSKMIQVQ